MMLRKKSLEKSGLLDEDFFMYGEDIDLSVRIKNSGYKIAYFPKTTIIHYKGESTRKSSLNYVKMFYNAMAIFSDKHFSGDKKTLYLLFLKTAIYIRAFFSLVKRGLSKIFHPAIDFALFFYGLVVLKNFWAESNFKQEDYYDNSSISINFIMYSLIWVLSLFFTGAYDRYFSLKNILKALLFGTLIILAIYGLLNPEYRSSRAILVMGFFASIGLLANESRSLRALSPRCLFNFINF